MRLIGGALLGALLAPLSASAAERTPAPPARKLDEYELRVRAETRAELFQRALSPGPNGARVVTRTVAPLDQYVLVEAHGIDVGGEKDNVDFEVAAWGEGLLLGDREPERSPDGDVQTAFVTYRQHPLALRLGRQLVSGGAARYTKLDGVQIGANLGAGFAAQAYAGLGVLPRWNELPGYEHLGVPPASLVSDPSALPAPRRSGYTVTGGRLAFASPVLKASLSYHEQHETAGLTRRNLGAEARADIAKTTSVGVIALLDTDSRRVADTRAWLDATPFAALDVSAEYLHTEPALFLSRQSVLSVFSTGAFDVLGGRAALRATRELALDAGGWVELYADGRPGLRSELNLRVLADRSRRTFARVGYARVQARHNGYHAVRLSLSRRVLAALLATLEGFGYLYDEPILGYRSSSVGAGTLSLDTSERMNVSWGTSLTRSPYSRIDVQTEIRVSLDFDVRTRRVAR